VRDGACPLRVETFVWSHGYLRMLSDQLGREYAEARGRRLAEELVSFHETCPDSPIYLLGHCAGCRVVLAAAAAAPPGIIDRVILLAPSVPAKYDLRPALRNTRLGIDACCSREDTFYLGVLMLAISSMQSGGYPAAGFSGFVPQVETPEDAALYTKLREHPWTPSLAWTGNYGGHYGCFRPGYLRYTVLPLLKEREAPWETSSGPSRAGAQ
jgi:hypothetical protein